MIATVLWVDPIPTYVQYVDENVLYSYNWCTKLAYASSNIRLQEKCWALGTLESATWAKLEWNPTTNLKVNKWVCELWLAKLSLYMGKWVLIVPWPAMLRWNQKSQPEMDSDFQKLTESPSEIQSGPNIP